MTTATATKTPLEAAYQYITPDGDCLIWNHPHNDPYNRFRFGKAKYTAQRVIWEEAKGELGKQRITRDETLCNNEKCVAPGHYKLVTPTSRRNKTLFTKEVEQPAKRGVTIKKEERDARCAEQWLPTIEADGYSDEMAEWVDMRARYMASMSWAQGLDVRSERFRNESIWYYVHFRYLPIVTQNLYDKQGRSTPETDRMNRYRDLIEEIFGKVWYPGMHLDVVDQYDEWMNDEDVEDD